MARDIPQGAILCLAIYAVFKKKKKEEKVRKEKEKEYKREREKKDFTIFLTTLINRFH